MADSEYVWSHHRHYGSRNTDTHFWSVRVWKMAWLLILESDLYVGQAHDNRYEPSLHGLGHTRYRHFAHLAHFASILIQPVLDCLSAFVGDRLKAFIAGLRRSGCMHQYISDKHQIHLWQFPYNWLLLLEYVTKAEAHAGFLGLCRFVKGCFM